MRHFKLGQGNIMGKIKKPLDPTNLRKMYRKEGFIQMVKDFPMCVDLGAKTQTTEGKREEIRSWFKDNFIRVHRVMGEDSDVIWDKNWRRFYFKKDEYSVMFKLRFL